MAVDSNNKHPSFSKLLEHGFISKIQMPAAFVKEHKKMLAKTCLLKTDEGLFWEAKIAREKPNNYFICEGDWARFVLHHKLEIGDMLIFFLVDKSTFQVLPYSKKPRTNVRHFEELSSSDEETIEASRKAKNVKTEPKESSGFIVNADSMLGKKKAPETEKAKKVAMELIELSDSEEESIDPLHGSKYGGNPCYSRPGKSDAKADNMLDVKKKALETKEVKKEGKVPDKPKWPLRSFYVKRGQSSSRDPHKPKKPASAFFIFMMDLRKKFKEEKANIKSVAAVTGGEKWKQLSDAEKAPYMAEAKKRMEEYHKNNDAYNKRVAAGESEEEESNKSMSEVDEEEGDDD